jgi:hypothetical protein
MDLLHRHHIKRLRLPDELGRSYSTLPVLYQFVQKQEQILVFIFMLSQFLNKRLKSADLISTDVKLFYIETATGTVQIIFNGISKLTVPKLPAAC